MKLLRLAAVALLLPVTTMTTAQSQPSIIDLTGACIVVEGKPNGVEAKAVQMLVEEVEKRTGIRLPVRQSGYKDARATIVVGTVAQLKGRAGHGARSEPGSDRAWNRPEGYLLTTSTTALDLPEKAASPAFDRSGPSIQFDGTPGKRDRASDASAPRVLPWADQATYLLHNDPLLSARRSDTEGYRSLSPPHIDA